MKTLIYFFSLVFLMNCYSLKTVTTSEKLPTQFDQTKIYRLTLKDHSKKIIAKNLKLENDTFFYDDKKLQPQKIGAAEVAQIDEREFSHGKTWGLVGGVTAAVVGAGFLLKDSFEWKVTGH